MIVSLVKPQPEPDTFVWRSSRTAFRSSRTVIPAEDRAIVRAAFTGRRAMSVILAETVEDSGCSSEAIRSRCRRSNATRARQFAMWRMHREGYGPPEIGAFFDRDSTTVAYSIRRIEGLA